MEIPKHVHRIKLMKTQPVGLIVLRMMAFVAPENNRDTARCGAFNGYESSFRTCGFSNPSFRKVTL